ncbi:MAG: signal recognition particle protein [Gemmatimonadetes bacterium]|nr:signal recognition particle protein [Gemmatimonadota bacterium]
MFDELSGKLDFVLAQFRARGLLTEAMVRDGLREVRRVLLEADVNFAVTRSFLDRVQERALGEAVLKSVSPGQQVVKIVHDELAALLGDEAPTIRWASRPPTVVLVVGLQGSGKTTTAGKLARRFQREGREPMLAACDLYRPAAVEQLRTLAERVGVDFHGGDPGGDPVKVAVEAYRIAQDRKKAVLVVDTAGRLQVDEPMMEELRRIRAELSPSEILLVADAMTGQEAVRIAEGFDKALDLTGIILTKMDGDARGGAALSIRGVVGKPIKFIGTGEGLDDLDPADPRRLADRILQRGDVVGLVERAQRAFDVEETKKLEGKVLGSGRFTLEDFLTAISQVRKMGPFGDLMKMIPGVARLAPKTELDPKRIKHVEAIILSMTPDERRRPEILNGSRRARIAKGSGRSVAEVNRLLKQFKEMKKMMRQMKGMQGIQGMRGMSGLLPH